MYLSEFLGSCDERYQDVGLPVGEPSPYLAKAAATYICVLIERGFEVFDFIELIYFVNSQYENRQGYNMAKYENEVPS